MENVGEIERFVTEITTAQPKMRSYVAKLVANASSVDDILQESNKVLWVKRAEWDEDSIFLKWAYRVCYFQVQAWRRDAGREKLIFSDELLDQLASEEPDEHSISEREEGLKSCLKKLRADQYRAVMGYYDPSVSLADLAKEREVSPNTLAQQLRRLRQRLHLCIENYLAKPQS